MYGVWSVARYVLHVVLFGLVEGALVVGRAIVRRLVRSMVERPEQLADFTYLRTVQKCIWRLMCGVWGREAGDGGNGGFGWGGLRCIENEITRTVSWFCVFLFW